MGVPCVLGLISPERRDLLMTASDANGEHVVSSDDVLDFVEVSVPAGKSVTLTTRTPDKSFWRFLWMKFIVKADNGLGQWTSFHFGERISLQPGLRLKRKVTSHLDDVRVSVFFPSSQGRDICDSVIAHDLCDDDQLGLVRQNYILPGRSEIRIVLRNTSNAERRVSGCLFGYALVD